MEKIKFYIIPLKWRFIVLILVISGITSFKSYALTINGNDVVCSGKAEIYTLAGTTPNTVYQWEIYKLYPNGTQTLSIANTLTLLANNQANIQWLETNWYSGFLIVVTGGGQTTSFNVLVMQTPNPYITTNNRVGCQEPFFGDEGYGAVIVDDKDGCINVCEYSTINYTAHGQSGSYYVWSVTGGVFSNGLTFISGTPYSPYVAMNNVTVIWGPQGPGNITVTEHNNFIVNCPSLPKLVCVNIIETPNAFFTFDNEAPDYPTDLCYDICINQTVHFVNLSTASINSPIVSYQWDFGDNSYSQLENPSHQYTAVSPTGSYTVTLKVTNKCGCTHTFQRTICVIEQEGLIIQCPSVVCENQNAIYRTETNCSPYTWTVTGGQIVGQADPEVTILWDNIGVDGFGYVSLDGSSCDGVCPFTTTIKVPVIQAIGTIEGPADICIDKNYKYTLPAWPATNFVWSFIGSNGSTFMSNEENSHEVEINAGSSTGSFSLKCTYVNTITNCSGIAIIDINVTDEPVIVNPPEEICVNNAGLGPLVLNTSYADYIIWTVKKPNGTNYIQSGSAGSSVISIPATTFASPGLYIIKADYTSGICDPEEIRIKVRDIPPAPTSITGTNPVCVGYPYTYNGDLLQGTTLSWAVTGGVISGSNTGNSVTVVWSGSGTLTAYRSWENLPGCTSTGYPMNINPIVISGTITPPIETQCEDGSYIYSIATNYPPETYEWSVFPASAGSISLGQGTAGCSITWNHIGNTTVSVRCKLVKCAAVYYINQTVQVYGSPTYTLTASPNPVCSGSNVSFSLSSSPSGFPVGGANYSWIFGDNTTAATAPVATSHTYFNHNSSNSTYPVTLTISNSGCGNAVATVFTSVEVKPSPVVNISPGIGQMICTNNGIPVPYTINLTSSVSGTVSYQWYYNSSIITGATTSTHTLTNNSNTHDGIYTLVVTASNGCTATSNQFELTYHECSGASSCTPLGTWGYPVLTQNASVCRQAQCSSTVTGSTNIWTYSWGEPAEPGYTGLVNGSNTMTSSPVYGFDKPGLYWIYENIHYKNAADPTNSANPCIISGKMQVMVPLVADFTMHVVCNANSNGYVMNLKDHSVIYYSQSFSNWEWFIDGVSTYYTQDVNTPFAISSGTHSIKLKVTLAGGHFCETTQTIVVPTLPVANFTVTSSDPLSGTLNPPFSSCSGNEVFFNNSSSVMNDLVMHVWTFGDGTSLHLKEGGRVYSISYPVSFPVNLTVTDKYGCINTVTKNISILKNQLSFNQDPNNQYTPNSQTVCLNQTIADILPNMPVNLQTPPFIQQWYFGVNMLGVATTAATVNDIKLNNANASGAYWVKVTDARGCYINVNPTPAKVSIKSAPTAIIEGKHDFCLNDNVKFKAVTGANPSDVTCNWVSNFAMPVFNSPTYSFVASAVGTFYIKLTVIQNSTGCITESALYYFTVHDLPSPAGIGVSPVDCNIYQLQLHAYTSVSPAYFNWSDGQYGQTIDVFHGGAYRVWLTDQYGCQSVADLEVAESPETYFWRFPTGCYTFCPGDLPKWVDGDKYHLFDRWEWYFNGSGNIISDNGINTNLGYGNNPYLGSGANTISDRLLIDLPSNGMGSGDYSWMLDNGLCFKESGIMNVNILESCCDIDMSEVEVKCISNGLYSLQFNMDNNTPGCPNAWYNLTVIDPSTNMTVGSFTYTSPAVLNPGFNAIYAEFQLLHYVPNAIFKLKVFCNSYETCIGYRETDIPECGEFGDFYNPEKSGKAILDTEENARLHIMPNPADAQLTIKYRFNATNTSGKKLLKIFDATGRPVKEIILGNNNGTLTLDVSYIAQGIYLIGLIDENKLILTKRLLINH